MIGFARLLRASLSAWCFRLIRPCREFIPGQRARHRGKRCRFWIHRHRRLIGIRDCGKSGQTRSNFHTASSVRFKCLGISRRPNPPSLRVQSLAKGNCLDQSDGFDSWMELPPQFRIQAHTTGDESAVRRNSRGERYFSALRDVLVVMCMNASLCEKLRLHFRTRWAAAVYPYMDCSGQLIPDTASSFSAAMAGASPSLD
ncbi:hypothetical protein BamMEX5DRAFT_6385 [Burkholderia ambifaria MEX-5]|uniref:Uncharacterized protein n=1 Tax=Burkholderia ambifaria MEX-5 TaxID=396597 RepID=B1TF19_9BURK|nr:hypothetical protein BamMEX5DRAFT_6385 [Burkholderia ambifaria MEX-5]